MRLLPPVLLCCLAAASCAAQRTLAISSDPAGAQVRMDGKPIGETPLELEFLHYGTHRITFHREGYRTHSRRVPLEPPWYARFPMDIISEVLLPVGWKDRHIVHAVLAPGTDEISQPDLRSVMERAEILRRAGPEGPRTLPPARLEELPNGDASTDPASP